MSGEVLFVEDTGGKLVASVPSPVVAESSVTPNSSGLSLTASELHQPWDKGRVCCF